MTNQTENPGRVRIQQLLAHLASKMPDDSKSADAPLYDWHLPRFFTGRQMKKVSDLASMAAPLIAKKFGDLCQQSFDVTITSASEHFASQFLGQQPDPPAGKTQGPCNYYLHFGTTPENPCGFVSIPPQSAVAWTTQLLGDTDTKENADKTLSELEVSLLFDMASLIIDCFAAAGEKWLLRPAAKELTNHLPFIPKPTEEFCKITFQVKVTGTDIVSEAHILILCENLAQAIGESSGANAKFAPKEISGAIQNHIETTPIQITAQLACVPVTVEELLNLSADDILVLDKKIDDPAVIIAAGRTVCRGKIAKSGGNFALVISETLF
jgi:flagellar motor switch protein FliM